MRITSKNHFLITKLNLVTRGYFFVAFFLFFAAPALAQNFGITLQVQLREVTKDAPFNIIVTVEGGDITEIIAPDAPENLVIISSNRANSQQSYKIINGVSSQSFSQVWLFSAKATKEGKVTIPPFHAMISGKEFESNSIDLEVTVGSASPNLNTGANKRKKWDKDPQPDANANANANSAAKKAPYLEDIVHLGCEVDRNEVYQGELVMLRLQLGNLVLPGSRSTISGARNMPPPPSTEGFYRGPEELKKETFKVGEFNYDGAEYYIPLYPTHEGDFEIGPWVWEGVVMGHVEGFGLQQKMVHEESETAKIKVKPLPERPAGFSGAVGSYDIKAKLRPNTLSQGIPAELVVTVSGHGNPDAIGAPELPELPWADIADPELATVRPDANDWSFANRIITYKLTPNTVGIFTLPSLDFVYFDPEEGAYKTKNTEEFKLEILESTESNQLVTMGGQTLPKSAEAQHVNLGKLAPAIREAGPLRPAATGGGIVANTVAVIFPLAGYAFCFAFLYRKRRYEEDPRFARHVFARKRSRERLKGLEEHSDPAEVLFKTVAAFVADRFSITAEGLTSADVHKLLRERGVTKALTDTFVRILRACERQRFAGGTLSGGELIALRDAAEDAMNELQALTEKHSLAEKRGRL